MITNRTFTQNASSHCFKLNRSYSVSFHLSNVGEIFRVESQRTVFKFRKRKLTFFVGFTYPMKQARVAVVQRRLRNVQKSVLHVQSCWFNCSCCRRRRRSPSNSLLLWSRNFATMVTWRHTSSLYCNCILEKNLRSLSHLGTPLQIMGVVQLVVREDNGELLALADYRKGGVAAGYRWPNTNLSG